MQPGDVLAGSARMAEVIAETEERVAATLDRAAETQPHRAKDLRVLSQSARTHAARARRLTKTRSQRPEKRSACG
jgi:hypothetical protein